MPEIDARKVRLVGGGITQDGEHGALIFAPASGEQFAVALRIEQFNELLRAAALLHSQMRKTRADVAPIQVERWSTDETTRTAVLALQVFGGLELRFELSRETGAVHGAATARRRRFRARISRRAGKLR